MTDVSGIVAAAAKRVHRNEGKIIGAKPPFPKHVWSIRTKLQVGSRVRDLALFNLAIDGADSAPRSRAAQGHHQTHAVRQTASSFNHFVRA